MADLVGVGKAFLDQVLGKLPEADRAAVSAALTKPEAEAALKTVGEGVLMRSDYSKVMDEVTKSKAELDAELARLTDVNRQQTAWYETNKPLLELGKKAKDSGWEGAGRTTDDLKEPVKLPDNVITKDALDAREQEAAGYMEYITRLGLTHLQTFGEILDVTALRRDPRAAKVGIQGVYDAIYGPKIQEKQSAAEKARIDKLVADGVAEQLRKTGSRPPYPTGANDEVSPLDALEAAQAKHTGADAQELADEYLAIVSRPPAGA